MRRLLSCLAFGLLLSSCDGPAARFDTFPVPRPVNLARELGANITLLGPDDTLRLQLAFDPATGLTSITDSGQIVLQARIFRQRGLYYAVEELRAGGCWVHALRIGRHQVQGLATGYDQMEDLSRVLLRGSLPAVEELVRYRSLTGDSIRLRFDARQLRRFYLAELDSFPSYRLASAPLAALPATVSSEAAVSLYPNPATSQATLTFATPAARTVQIYTTQGQLMQTIPTQGLSQRLTVRELTAGTYLVRISSPTAQAQTTRLLVQH